MPNKDMGSKVFNFLEHDRTDQNFISSEIYAECESGELINDAVYRRNRIVEEKFNVKIKGTKIDSDKVESTLKKSVLIGDQTYQAIDTTLINMSSILRNDLLVDLNTVPYLDFEKPWWDQRATSDLSLAGKRFINVSSLNLSTNQATWVIVFNKKMIEENELENPYELVKNDKWTLDKFYEHMKGVSKDLNGNGELDTEDQWPFATEHYNTLVMVLGSGEKVFAKDENDMPYIAMNTDRNINVFNKVMDIMMISKPQ